MPADRSAARAPLASLLSKSEKALQKLAAGTWQHAMLRADVAALRVACVLLQGEAAAAGEFTQAQLAEAQQRLAALTAKSAQAQPKFAPGSAQHTLLHNRIAALQLALHLVRAATECAGGAALRPRQQLPGEAE
ncbi:hypothetical protein [Pseudoduganella sp.]|uniref:hypothetical protein n=1 Tax=Pseudoduganella sp. TaxID=1880898 RepID=UPI0035AE65F2